MPLDAMSDESDEALLMRYAAGDQAAAQALTLRLTPRVYAHACRMLGIPAEAEDVTQEALMRLWRIAPEWRRGEAQVTTWLFRVVANLCTDRLRRARGVALDDVPEPEDGQASAAEQMQQQSRAERHCRRRWVGCPTGSAKRLSCGISRVCRTRRSPRSWRPASRRSRA